MESRRRKHPRLKSYDYSAVGSYFITICTKGRRELLSSIPVGRDDPGAPVTTLLPTGRHLDELIRSTPSHYPNVSIDHYVIMPNHVHILLTIREGAPGSSRPTVSQVIGFWKRMTNKIAGENFWQDSFHDHIIRDERDYLVRWQYIDDNPARWAEDEYYNE